MSFPAGTIVDTSFNATLASAVQDRTLSRVFRDALAPRMLYRGEAVPEEWPANLGASTTFTRSGLIRPRTRPLAAGQDPAATSWDVEQWNATAAQYAQRVSTSMPTSSVALASTYLRNIHQLGIAAGQSINRVVRDKLVNAYLSGNTVATAAGAGVTALPVAFMNGFTRQHLNGIRELVSSGNPLSITIKNGGGDVTRNVIGFSPDVAGDECFSGTLTLDAVATWDVRDAVLAVNRSEIVRPDGSFREDDLASTDILTLNAVKSSIAKMRNANVPPHEDDLYHCHLDPIAEQQIFADAEMKQVAGQSLPDHVYWRRFSAGVLLGVAFYRNSEAPQTGTVDLDPTTGNTFAGVTAVPATGAISGNRGVPLHFTIITGAGAVEERYIDESQYISAAGVNGKIGEFAVTNAGMQIMTERVRLILRAPQDALQQQTDSSYSITADWPIPTDYTNKASAAVYKRASVIQHGG